MSARYITTTLPYVNADAHLGHAIEFVEADCYTRALRLKGDDVFLNIGTDEHGAKIAERAEQEGQSPREYTDDYAARFKAFADKLGISYSAFTRTTDPSHLAAAQEFWRRCVANGDIYKAVYETKYCIGCELEKTDSELEDGRCPIHPNREIDLRTEENYYFKFSKYQDALLDLYRTQPDFVVPEARLREIRTFVEGGLKDFSISRRKEKLSWGVPVPGDDDHVMYVWFDALVNYISAIGWPTDESSFTKWWPVTQFAGKDNLRQQSAMWQAMLLSAGLPLSRQVFIHGFILSGGQKMSKSLGNVINPVDLIDKYGTDAVRYILLRHVSPSEDSDLTLEAIQEHYTANLTNGLGNLVARVMQMATAHFQSPIEMTQETQPDTDISAQIQSFEFNKAMDRIWERIGHNDALIALKKPFIGVKSEDVDVRDEALLVIKKLVRELDAIATELEPFMPSVSAQIKRAVKDHKKPENLFPRL